MSVFDTPFFDLVHILLEYLGSLENLENWKKLTLCYDDTIVRSPLPSGSTPLLSVQ